MFNINIMNHTISTSSNYTKLSNNLGYILTIINVNMLSNSIISATYYHLTDLSVSLKDTNTFYNYNDLLIHINTLKESLVLVDDEQYNNLFIDFRTIHSDGSSTIDFTI